MLKTVQLVTLSELVSKENLATTVNGAKKEKRTSVLKVKGYVFRVPKVVSLTNGLETVNFVLRFQKDSPLSV